MSNDFLISLRDFDVTGTGEPRTGMGEKTTYFEMSADQPLYYWQHQTPQEEWLARLRAVGKSVLVFVHGFADDAGKVVERHRTIKPHLPSGFSLVSFIGRPETKTVRTKQTREMLGCPRQSSWTTVSTSS